MDEDFSYQHFVNCLLEGDQREFYYQDKIIVITSYPKRVDIYIEQNGLIEARKSFSTVQECLSLFRIDNKSLEELWSKLRLA